MEPSPENHPTSPPPATPPDTNSKQKSQKSNTQNIFLAGFFVVVGVVVLYALFTSFSAIFSDDRLGGQQAAAPSQNSMGERKTRMGLTSFDAGLAKRFMDKDNDGKCDACGMPVEMCMDSGQLQCNMDPESTIGDLGTQHIHADWKLYINGEVLGEDALAPLAMDMSKGDNILTSSFIHLDKGAPVPEKTGDVLHMHATGVPLWIFFDSVELELPESTKVYVNGKLNSDGLNYVFNDLDKILITDGVGDLQQQLNSVTNFAEKHSEEKRT